MYSKIGSYVAPASLEPNRKNFRGATEIEGTVMLMFVIAIGAGIVMPSITPEYEMPLTVVAGPLHVPEMKPLPEVQFDVGFLSKTAIGVALWLVNREYVPLPYVMPATPVLALVRATGGYADGSGVGVGVGVSVGVGVGVGVAVGTAAPCK